MQTHKFISADSEFSSGLLLLTFALELRKYLQTKQFIEAIIPRRVYDAMSPEALQELLHDHLASISRDVGRQLKIRVKDVSSFEIKILESGEYQ